MPLCIACATYLPYLYTVYDSADNLRLDICPSCKAFADPYVEHDALVVLLDLILLKAGAYRHLLFNRNANPRREGKTTQNVDEDSLAKARWLKTLKLAVPMIAVDSYVRWTQLNLDQHLADSLDLSAEALALARVVAGCIIETLAFHVGVTIACALVLYTTDLWRAFRRHPASDSGIRREFRFSHVPLTLVYSSATKLFLLCMLSIWRVAPPPSHTSIPNPGSVWQRALAIFDEDSLDRMWVVRNLLGGMAAGFGLRIILDCHPILTMLVVLSGWTVKTGVASFLGTWVAGPERTRVAETWLAYSIP